jgi:hypothetical protein
MNGWNRLFVVVAIFWTVAVPFLVVHFVNSPVEQTFNLCTDLAYHRYGASDSWIRFDWDKYQAETAECFNALKSDRVLLPTILSAMVGMGDGWLALTAWGFILFPLGVLWAVGWGLGRTVRWVAAGFRR